MYNSPMTPNKHPPQQSEIQSPSGFVKPQQPQRPMTPTSNSQMMYHQAGPNMPPQYHPYGSPHHSSYRTPPSSMGSSMPPPYNYPDPNYPATSDPNYGKMPAYPQQSTAAMPPQHPQHPPHPHHPSQGKPQYLLNLLANNAGGGGQSAPPNASNLPTPQAAAPNSQSQQIHLPPGQPPHHQQHHQQKPAAMPSQPQSIPDNIQPPPISQHQQQLPNPPTQSGYYGPPTIPQHMAPQPPSHHYQQQHQQQASNYHEVGGLFPPSTIEAVQPKFSRKKKMTSKDVNQIEAWRLMMSLKSGLLAESTWALDVLSILIHDDSTYLYFGLQKLPGLLDILLEYYKHYLTEIFTDLFQNDSPLEESKPLRNGNGVQTDLDREIVGETIKRMKKRFNSELSDEELVEPYEVKPEEAVKLNGDVKPNKNKKKKEINVNSQLVDGHLKEESPFKQFVLSPKNDYTFVTRTGKPVKIHPDENLFVADFDKTWDVEDNKQFKMRSESKLYFSKGFGSITSYIQKHFEVGESSMKFAHNLDKMYEEYDRADKENSHNLMSNDDEVASEQASSAEPADECKYPKFRSDRCKYNLNFESEAYKRDQPPLCTLNDYNETISRRCVCISTLIRNMSFVPGNEVEFAKYKDLLFILGKLVLLHHQHFETRAKAKTVNLAQLEETLFNEIEGTENADQLNSLTKKSSSSSCETLDYLLKDEWWWDTLHFLRENALVTLANISGKLDLSKFPEEISLPIFSGLLHWMVCRSSDAQDHLPSTSMVHLSPRRLSLECLAKLSILEGNVDLILSTPPWERILQLFRCLAEQLSRDQEQALREFALVLLHNLAINDVAIARAIATSIDCIAQLVNYIEFAEQKALDAVNAAQNYHVLKENPECFGTTQDMIRRSATTLRCLARVPENRKLFFNFQERLIALSMSPVLHPTVTQLVADILYECSLSDSFTADQTALKELVTIPDENSR